MILQYLENSFRIYATFSNAYKHNGVTLTSGAGKTFTNASWKAFSHFESMSIQIVHLESNTFPMTSFMK